jgi:hypothetical protein
LVPTFHHSKTISFLKKRKSCRSIKSWNKSNRKSEKRRDNKSSWKRIRRRRAGRIAKHMPAQSRTAWIARSMSKLSRYRLKQLSHRNFHNKW